MKTRSSFPVILLLAAIAVLAPPTTGAAQAPTNTPTATQTPRFSGPGHDQFPPTATITRGPSRTRTPTRTATNTRTPTLTPTATRTPSPTVTGTLTATPSRTSTQTPVFTPYR